MLGHSRLYHKHSLLEATMNCWRLYALATVLLLLLWLSPLTQGFVSNASRPKGPARLYSTTTNIDPPVLVVGATGKTGRRVVQRLLGQGVPVRALVRDRSKARDLWGTDTGFVYPPLEIVRGDVSAYEDKNGELERAVKGCRAVLNVMGVVRFSKLSDFLFPWRLFGLDASRWATRDHPYYGNYLGQIKLIELAEKYNIERYVRLSGLSMAYPAFNPVRILFNTLLSCTSKWQTLTEQAIVNSSVPYVILRPGGLAENWREKDTTNLQVDPSGKLPLPGRIGRADVAALAVDSIAALPSTKSYTLACRWCGEGVLPKAQGEKEDGFSSATACLENLTKLKDAAPIPSPKMQPFAAYVSILVYSLIAVALKSVLGLARLLLKLFNGS